MSRRTAQSVTDLPCECGYLERSANDPDSPIKFDSHTNEYQIQYEERRPTRKDLLSRALLNAGPSHAMLVVYHCPWCGGAAPESKRAQLFRAIPSEEETRLANLLHSVRTVEQAVELLGPPDFHGHASSKSPEGNGDPPKVRHYYEIVYQRLSDVAEVRITEGTDGRAHWQLHGKYKSLPEGT